MNIGTAKRKRHVSFTDLRIDSAGSGKQLQASASGLTERDQFRIHRGARDRRATRYSNATVHQRDWLAIS